MSFRSYYKKQTFHPGFFSLFLNPFFFIRKGLYKHIKRYAGQLHGNLLDFGCGSKPYKNLFAVNSYLGVDFENEGHPHDKEQVDVFYDGKRLPFDNDHFDSILCSEVFEHIFNIDEVITELYRVLKPGGKMLVTVPFVWSEHELPFDYGRYSRFGIRYLLEKNHFVLLEQSTTTHFAETIIQLWVLYIYHLFRTSNKFLNLFCTIIFISPFNLLGVIFAWILPRKNGLYHNNVILVQKPLI
jgi:SAM-dependent methyltransferase